MVEAAHQEALAFRLIKTPAGTLLGSASAVGLRALEWGRSIPPEWAPAPADSGAEALLDQTEAQLAEYFGGSRREFELPLDPVGTPFQLEAWLALREIPFGQTRSYAQQAVIIGRPSAVRAVGAANGKNPISIVVPCHRVIGSSGSLTGYAGGIDVKEKLLALESSQGVLF